MARTPEKLEELKSKYPQNLEIVQGDVFNKESVLKTIETTENSGPVDGIVISLGTRPFGKTNADVCSKGTQVIIEAMKEKDLKRVVCVSSFAVGDSWNDSGFFAKGMFWLFLGRVLADKEIQEKELTSSGLDWTIFRPGGLMNGTFTGKYRVGEHISGGRVARSDVAHAILKEFEENTWLKKTPTLAN